MNGEAGNMVLAKVFTPDTTYPLQHDLMHPMKTKANKQQMFKEFMTVLLCPLVYIGRLYSGPLSRVWAFAWLKSQLPTLDVSVVVLGKPELHGSKNISLGRNLYLYRELYLETRDDGQIRLGDDVVISRGVHIVAHQQVTIGNGSMVGEYTSIRDANHRFGAGVTLRSSGMDSSPVVIGENVWIGRGVTILPGVIIGDGAVIGANAVVTHSVPAMAVMGGIPARHLHQEART